MTTPTPDPATSSANDPMTLPHNTVHLATGGSRDLPDPLGKEWIEKRINLEQRAKNMVGDILLASGVCAYLGCFTGPYRSEACARWRTRSATPAAFISLNSSCGPGGFVPSRAVHGEAPRRTRWLTQNGSLSR